MTGTLKQILLITDGCSNMGEDPVNVAELAFEHGITVNVIGIVDRENERSKRLDEIINIATAGGGLSDIVYKADLSQTVQALTRQAMSQTLQGFVNKELFNIFGSKTTLAEVAPDKRTEVMEVIDELEETCNLEVLILVDTSASMTEKLLTVKEALIDLSMNLQSRSGENMFSVWQFPSGNEAIGNIANWSDKLAPISVIFPRLLSGGMTPTGPALKAAIQQFSKRHLNGYEDEFYEAHE